MSYDQKDTPRGTKPVSTPKASGGAIPMRYIGGLQDAAIVLVKKCERM